MNVRHQELFDRLRSALDNISGSPKTAAEVSLIFEDLVVSLEEIATDLKMTSDDQTAATLKAIIHTTMPINDIPAATGRMTATF